MNTRTLSRSLGALLLSLAAAAGSLVALPAAVRAEAPASPARGQPGREIRISLADAVALSLRNNHDIALARIAPDRAATEVTRQQGAFDPVLSAAAGVERDRTPTGSTALGSFRNGAAGEVRLSGRLRPGTEYDLSYGTTRQETDAQLAPFSPSSSASVLLRVKQPLLRGFGSAVGGTGISVARGNQRIADAASRRAAEQTLSGTVDAYWRLVRAQRSLGVARESLDLAGQLARRTEARVASGDLPPVELTQARASIAAREEAVIAGEAEVGNANDALARHLVVDSSTVFDVTLVPIDAPGGELASIAPDTALADALRLRPELEAARQAVRTAEVALKYARNQRLPDLSAVGAVGVGGLDPTWTDAHGQLVTDSDSSYRWSLGVTLSVPLGNRSADAAHADAKLALTEAQLSVRRLELQVTEDVRRAVRTASADAKRIESTSRAAQLAREQLAAAEKRLDAGLSTSFEVLRLQTDLAAAQNAEISAATNYRSSLIRVDLAAGTLLDRFGLRFN